jgi:hypothetical protein
VRAMSRIVAVVGGLLLIAACSRGRQAEKLDRETALSLLRESGGAALPAPTVEMAQVPAEPGAGAHQAHLDERGGAPRLHRDAVVARET